MKLVLTNEKLVVLDDLMPADHFDQVWQYVQQETYAIPHYPNWIKVWRLGDNYPFGSTEYKSPIGKLEKFSNGMDFFLPYLAEVVKRYPQHCIGSSVTLRSYLYPRGTKLSWHDDAAYQSAVVFYTHKVWEESWGGELFIAGGETKESGIGYYIQPKPNRLVITRSPLWHQINRVDPDAGENVRSSIVGFFNE